MYAYFYVCFSIDYSSNYQKIFPLSIPCNRLTFLSMFLSRVHTLLLICLGYSYVLVKLRHLVPWCLSPNYTGIPYHLYSLEYISDCKMSQILSLVRCHLHLTWLINNIMSYTSTYALSRNSTPSRMSFVWNDFLRRKVKVYTSLQFLKSFT